VKLSEYFERLRVSNRTRVPQVETAENYLRMIVLNEAQYFLPRLQIANVSINSCVLLALRGVCHYLREHSDGLVSNFACLAVEMSFIVRKHKVFTHAVEYMGQVNHVLRCVL
jgi:hypothetical protein